MTRTDWQDSMSNSNSSSALLIFTKAPVLGEVKTRLIPGIGARRALSIYKELLTKTLLTARKAGFSTIQVWVSGDIEHCYFVNLKNRYSIQLKQQSGKDLGQRMSNAFDITLSRYSSAVLIGCDCPSLEYSDLSEAKKHLENNADVVLGPAVDGGYYLIGLNKNDKQLFADIKWGRDSVFNDTCANIDSLNWKMKLLSRRWDVDRITDLLPYYRTMRTASVLN